MNHRIFTVHDKAAEVYLPPFFVPTVGLATRAFKDCVNSNDHQFGAHPDHYTLFELGEFDDNTGAFLLHNAPQSIGNGVTFLDTNHVSAIEDFENASDTPVQPNENSGDSA